MKQTAYTRYRNKILREIRNQKKLGLDIDIELPLTERQLRRQGVQGQELRHQTIGLRKSIPSLKAQTKEAREVSRETLRALAIEQSHSNVNPPEEYIRHGRFRRPETETEREVGHISARRQLTEAQRQAISERVRQEWASGRRHGHKWTEEQRRQAQERGREQGEIRHQVAEAEREREREQRELQEELERQDREAREQYVREQEEYYSEIFGDIQAEENRQARSERTRQSWERRRERRQTREEIEENILHNLTYTANEDQRFYDIFHDWFAKIASPFPEVSRFNYAREIQQVILDVVADVLEEIGEQGVGFRLWSNLGEARLAELTEIIMEPSDQSPERIIASNEIISALTNSSEVSEEQASALSDYNDMLMFSQLPLL